VTRILLTGKTGQLGRELRIALKSVGEIIAPDRTALDLTRPDSIRALMREIRPDIVVNAAGFTTVDQAESERDVAMQVNGLAPGVFAEEARRCGALLLHYSTTFVFDGTKRGPYVETDAPNPVNAYGRSKLAGEEAIAAAGCSYIIMRATWTYSENRVNFPLTLLRLAREKEEIPVVQDQVASPTWARTYAAAGAKLLESPAVARENAGTYHASAAGQTSRCEFARRIVELARQITGQDAGWARIRPIMTREYPLPAIRPLNTVISSEKIGRVFGLKLRHWDEDLRIFLAEMLGKSGVAGNH
jgi:dTDP-4-dehydrorhamnose reductase